MSRSLSEKVFFDTVAPQVIVVKKMKTTIYDAKLEYPDRLLGVCRRKTIDIL